MWIKEATTFELFVDGPQIRFAWLNGPGLLKTLELSIFWALRFRDNPL
jgi:hypothetical protein